VQALVANPEIENNMISKICHFLIIIILISLGIEFNSCKSVFPNNGKEIDCNGKLVFPVMNPTQRSSFPGGKNALFAFIYKNTNLPTNRIRGNIKVAFITTKDGGICDFRVISSSNDDLEKEIIRIFKLMPKWNPAIDNGRIVDSYEYIKFVFKK
jgi:hypothetical protein